MANMMLLLQDAMVIHTTKDNFLSPAPAKGFAAVNYIFQTCRSKPSPDGRNNRTTTTRA
jgi:hypothetical protein